jgi:crossover junction endodeoxyribonuclease RuvC
MKILGIDPGTQCGWAIIDGETRIDSGTWDLKNKEHEGAGFRYLKVRRYLLALIIEHNPAMLSFEVVRSHKGTAAAHVYGGIVGQVKSVCEEVCLPFKGVDVGTVKKLATGKGNAGKPAMVKAANKRWACKVGDDNEADALWVAEALRVEMG